jgi:hypothetical protein
VLGAGGRHRCRRGNPKSHQCEEECLRRRETEPFRLGSCSLSMFWTEVKSEEFRCFSYVRGQAGWLCAFVPLRRQQYELCIAGGRGFETAVDQTPMRGFYIPYMRLLRSGGSGDTFSVT